MQPIDTTATQRFLEMIKRASQVRSRDVRVEMNDAVVLAAEIGLVLARLAALQDADLNSPQASGLDGGSLR